MSLKGAILELLQCSNNRDSYHSSKQARSLSCGHFICKDCLPDDNSEMVICWHCFTPNRIPLSSLKQFPDNATAKMLFEQSIDLLFDDLCLKFKNELSRLKQFGNDNLEMPFKLLRQQINDKVEAIKHEFDMLKNKMFVRLDRYKISKKCELEAKLSEINVKFYEEKYFELNELVLKQIKQNEETFFYYQNNLDDLEAINSELRQIKTSMKFVEFDFTSKIHEIGYIDGVKAPFTSKILNTRDIDDMLDLCEFNPGFKWKLIYRASEDGFDSNDFHRKCDDYLDTFTLITTKTNYIFGGYTSLPWGLVKPEEYSIFRREFVISIKNPTKKMIRFDCRDNDLPKKYRNTSRGPNFCNDICISSNSNINHDSFISIGNSYVCNGLTLDLEEAKTFFTGSKTFLVDEIEVFKIFT
jgi:hypothetical protein